ncbi:MAG: crossover junction endodeoxyribonuclease RuvC [Acidimicrobiales bacterium]
MFVLGIDPGLSRCGYGAVRSTPAGPRAQAVGVIRTDPAEPLPQRLAELQRELRALIAELAPDVVAVERVFFQVNVRTAMSVGQASGLAMAEAVAAGCEVAQYSPNEVKLAVAGDGAADKAAVGTMVARLLGLAGVPRPADAADAAALALCHLAHAPVRARLAAAGAGSARMPR